MRNELTETQKKALELAEDNTLTNAQRADKMGVKYSTYLGYLSRARGRLARVGLAPEYDMKHPVPEGFMVKGVSTYYNEEGKVSGQWVKSSVNREEQFELLKQCIAEQLEYVKPVLPAKNMTQTDTKLANLFVLTDYHLGMMAWEEEGGDNWDLKIAENMLYKCFSDMVTTSPRAKKAIIFQGGDFLHSDGLTPVTPTSGHVLDQDGRYSKIVRTCIKLIRFMVDTALESHDEVHVVMAEGNHDISSSVWMRELLSTLYSEEPRVTVDTTPKPYYAVKHGANMVCFHHGHMKKGEGLPLLFATDFSEMWGQTKYRYVHKGHYHHQETKEYSGITVEQHQTLAAKDAYSSRGGYHANRGAVRITYHSEFGEVSRETKRPEMFV